MLKNHLLPVVHLISWLILQPDVTHMAYGFIINPILSSRIPLSDLTFHKQIQINFNIQTHPYFPYFPFRSLSTTDSTSFNSIDNTKDIDSCYYNDDHIDAYDFLIKQSSYTYTNEVINDGLDDNQSKSNRFQFIKRIKQRIQNRRHHHRPQIQINNISNNNCYQYNYEYKELILSNSKPTNNTTFVLLIHPIGVGISKWYYDRLLNELSSQQYQNQNQNQNQSSYIFLIPDLLGCGSACNPHPHSTTTKLPLLYPSDWSKQMIDFMQQYQSNYTTNAEHTRWCIVSNGGCIPIAFHIANYFLYNPTCHLTNLILSAAPSLSSMQTTTTATTSTSTSTSTIITQKQQQKIQKSYRRLSGIIGTIFWWYALRNNGQFIQQFSEKNLVSKPNHLGNQWRKNCVNVARNKQSRFSTFAFLAGSLRGNYQDLLDTIATQTISNSNSNSKLKVDIFRGIDKRTNSAKR